MYQHPAVFHLTAVQAGLFSASLVLLLVLGVLPVPISVSLVPLMKIRFYALKSDPKQS
jgi:O-antigen/teichoic acid export membrane protein